jgi:hypothetical protein
MFSPQYYGRKEGRKGREGRILWPVNYISIKLL